MCSQSAKRIVERIATAIFTRKQTLRLCHRKLTPATASSARWASSCRAAAAPASALRWASCKVMNATRWTGLHSSGIAAADMEHCAIHVVTQRTQTLHL